MTVPLALIVYAVLMATMGAWALRRAHWPERAPSLGIATWQAMSTSTLTATMLAGLGVAVRAAPSATGLTGLWQACLFAVSGAAPAAAEVLFGSAALSIVLGILVLACWGTARGVCVARRRARRQQEILQILTPYRRDLGVLILEDHRASVFCLPGRGQQVVLTTAALSALKPEEFRAVLAHERAHLRAHHHLLVAAAAGLAMVFPAVPVFAEAHAQIRRLVEIAADDSACHHHPPATVAAALLAVAGGASPPAALAAAAGGDTPARVHRLLDDYAPLGHVRQAMTAAAVVLITLTPLAIVAVSALAEPGADYCHLPAAAAAARVARAA